MPPFANLRVHPINGDEIKYYLTSPNKIEAYTWGDDPFFVDRPYLLHPQSKIDGQFYELEIEITSNCMIISGWELYDELIKKSFKERFEGVYDFYYVQELQIDLIDFFAEKNIFYVIHGWSGALFQRSDGELVFTNVHEFYDYDDDLNLCEEELEHKREMDGIKKDLGETYLFDSELMTDKFALVCDKSLLPNDTKEDKYQEVEVENGIYQIKYNFYRYEDDPIYFSIKKK